jgi:mRNA-degrading endonuclease toxin of MazEF toxin-antitoxin module
VAVNERDIVELNYELPDGRLKTHPALIISNNDVFEMEGIFYALMISSKPFSDEFSFELKDEMLTRPMQKKSYVKCQLIQSYTEDEIIKRRGALKQVYFEKVIKKLNESVF